MRHVGVHSASASCGVDVHPLVRRPLYAIGCIFLLLLETSIGSLQAQDCNCPTICVPCAGGVLSLSLRYDGEPTLVTVNELNHESFSDYLNTGDIITLSGSLPNGRFRGNSLDFESWGAIHPSP